MATNHQRQMWAVQNLEISPRENCEITKFCVEEWSTSHICVQRGYRPQHAQSIYYSQTFVIGPRGGIRKISDYMNY